LLGCFCLVTYVGFFDVDKLPLEDYTQVPIRIAVREDTMADELPTMTFKAIGIVRNELKQAASASGARWEVVSEIVIDSSLTEALDRLEEYSHITVLWWMHLLTLGEVRLKVHPMGREEFPPKGIFALRTPNRPNPIGKTTVRLLQRQGNILMVEGLEALDGSPVIDVKPYLPRYDSIADATVPQWITNR